MKAKEVHSNLWATLTPALRANGFLPMTKAKKAWYREGNRIQIIKLQLDLHFGYLPLFGGRLFLRAWISELLLDQPEGITRPLTPMELLPIIIRAEMNELEDRVSRKILAKQGWDEVLGAITNVQSRALLENERARLVASASIDFSPAKRLDAMSYLDSGDVSLWAKFLAASLPVISESLNQHDRS